MNTAKFYIKRRKDQQYYFMLNAANNQTILVGEGYSTKQNCLNGINSVKVNSTNEDRFEANQSKSGEQWYFVLKAMNNQVIGRSEVYNSKQATEKGIAAVKNNASDAPVVEDPEVQRSVNQ